MKGYLVAIWLGVLVLFYGRIKATISKFTKQFIEPLVIEVEAKWSVSTTYEHRICQTKLILLGLQMTYYFA